MLDVIFENKIEQGLYPFLNKKFKDFEGAISHFLRIPFSAKRSPESVFSSSSSHEQFYPEALSMFASFRHLRIWVG